MSGHGANDINPKLLIQCLEEWREMDDQLKAIQDRKKTIIGALRTKHGRLVAEGVKQAMNYMMKDATKRHEAMYFADAGRRYVEMLEAAGAG